ncbi:MAG: hypothetical protein K5880_14335 [Hydrogenophaga sp.]|uniref:hypothetical protein n=1 Tax=Hydrogenophaga sp. TaxID=1904254 RepID=UPI002627402D|nr:hypothetical protein [Hydrogenophaga sp.]MCV0439802.1 hypothetical protein [Hydrogenophaga sp.]
MVGVGNIVSVGGFGTGGGGGGSSGIQNLNGQTGPVVTLVGTSGIVVAPVAPNIINIGFTGSITQSGVLGVNGIDVEQVGGNFIVDGAALSGLIVPSGGIGSINGQIGPAIDVKGVNGVEVTVSAENCLLVDGAGASGVSGGGGSASGLCYAADFPAVTSTTITHNLGTTNVVVDVFDASDNKMIADGVSIVDLNSISLRFNSPQRGKVVIVACGGNDTNLEECKRYALLVS